MEKTISPQEYKDALKLIALFKAEQTGIPQPLENPDYSVFKDTMVKYIDLLQKGVIGDDDFKQEIFISAIEAVFGTGIWKWVELHTRTRLSVEDLAKRIVPQSPEKS